MPRSKTTLSQLRVGLLTLVTIAILIVLILSVTGDISLFKKTLTYKTRLTAADGLKSGDEVRLGGKLVGQVDSVNFGTIPSGTEERPRPILVTMTVSAEEVGQRIREDSEVVLGQQGFLGDRVIDITPGTAEKAPLPDGAEIKSADAAGLAEVFSGANDILVQFNKVGAVLEEIVKDIEEGKGNVGKFLKDEALYVNLNRTVVESQALLNRIQEGQGTIARLLNDPKLYDDLRGVTSELQTLTTDLRAGKGTAGKFLTDDELYNQARDAVTNANHMLEKFDRITAEVEAGRGTFGRLVKEEKLYNDLQATMASFRSISERLDKGEGAAGKFLHDDRLYNNFNQMSSEMVKLLYDFRQNPRKYLSVKVSLF